MLKRAISRPSSISRPPAPSSLPKPRFLFKNEIYYELIAWLAAIITGLLTFLIPEKRARRYRRAWTILNNQITRFLADPHCTIDQVLRAYNDGERVLHESRD